MTPRLPRFGRLAACLALAAVGVGCGTGEYNPAPVRSEAQSLTFVVQLTTPIGVDAFERAGEARLSPDMRWVVFRAIPRGAARSVTSGEPYGLFVARVRWSVDGGHHIVGLDRPVRITRVGTPCGAACFSPDKGFSLAFTAGEPPASGAAPDPGRMRLFRADNWEQAVAMTDVARGVDLAQHPVTPPELYVVDCDWSPTGRSIAIAASTDTGPLALYGLRPNGSRLMRLGPTVARGPVFSPDGHRLAYRTGPASAAHVCVADVVPDIAGDAVGLRGDRPLTHEAGIASTGPCWTPDGTHVVYASTRTGKQDLYVMSAVDGDHKTRLTTDPGPDTLPTVSPDGHHLIWTSTRGSDNTPQLFAADLTLPEGS